MTTTRVAMDIGGTFTDFVVYRRGGGHLPPRARCSTTPANPAEGVLDGLEQSRPELGGIEFLVHGTTVGPERVPRAQGRRGCCCS